MRECVNVACVERVWIGIVMGEGVEIFLFHSYVQ